MPKWEYKSVLWPIDERGNYFDAEGDALVAWLNEHGARGWELVYVNARCVCIFKRPRKVS